MSSPTCGLCRPPVCVEMRNQYQGRKGCKKTKPRSCLPCHFTQWCSLGMLSKERLQRRLEVNLDYDFTACIAKNSSRKWSSPMCKWPLCILEWCVSLLVLSFPLCCPAWHGRYDLSCICLSPNHQFTSLLHLRKCLFWMRWLIHLFFPLNISMSANERKRFQWMSNHLNFRFQILLCFCFFYC